MIQLLIALTGGIAILLTQISNQNLRKYAPIFGILGQPFWFYTSYVNGQWGIFVLTIFYAYAWSIGLYNTWFRGYYGNSCKGK